MGGHRACHPGRALQMDGKAASLQLGAFPGVRRDGALARLGPQGALLADIVGSRQRRQPDVAHQEVTAARERRDVEQCSVDQLASMFEW